MQPVLERYTTPAIALHWLMAALLAGLLAIGHFMTGLELSPQKLQFFSWHKWAGVSAFALALLRMAWRLWSPPAPLPSTLARAQRRLAAVGHAVLYGLMLTIPVSGWLMSSAKGFQTVWFGVLPIPDLIGKDRQLAEGLTLLHGSLNWCLVLVVSGHVLAALKHHWLERNPILWRMIPHRPHKETP